MGGSACGDRGAWPWAMDGAPLRAAANPSAWRRASMAGDTRRRARRCWASDHTQRVRHSALVWSKCFQLIRYCTLRTEITAATRPSNADVSTHSHIMFVCVLITSFERNYPCFYESDEKPDHPEGGEKKILALELLVLSGDRTSPPPSQRPTNSQTEMGHP